MTLNYLTEYAEATRQSWADGMARLIPSRMIPDLVCYIVHGIHPGNFLSAVVSNDLMDAVARADEENQKLLVEYSTFLYNYAPIGCFGSKEAFLNWKGVNSTSNLE